MSHRRNLVINAQFKKATCEPIDYVKFAMDEANINTWYVSLSQFAGDNGEYYGGEYLVRVELPEEFPFKPPHFYFLTEQGLYGVETKVCISIGEYHSDQYRPVLGVSGFCTQLVSGLIGASDMGGGINIKKTTCAEKARLAARSVETNRVKNGAIMSKINRSFLEYSANWPKDKITPIVQAMIDAAKAAEGIANDAPAM
jgi:ubiquitin-conjugating enzyme E2 J2